MGDGREKAKESRVVPHPKLNPGCATAYRAIIGGVKCIVAHTKLGGPCPHALYCKFTAYCTSERILKIELSIR